MFSANMGCKIFIAPPLVVLLHFIERFAGGCSRRIEHPSAFGATPALKTLIFDPYQFALHGLLSTSFDLLRLCSSSATATTKAALFSALSEVPPKPPVFEHTKSEVNTQGLNINDRRGCCLWGIQHCQELLSQSKVILELLNDVVTLAGGFFEFPAVHNLHCTSHVFYYSFFL